MASPGAPTPTLTAQLKEAAAAFPSLRAVAVPGKLELTHAQLVALVDAAAALLADSGVRPGDVVALSFPNSVELVIMVQAVIQARAVAAPLNPALTQEQLEFFLADSMARLLITNATGNAAAQAAAGAAAANLGLGHATATLHDAAGLVRIAGLRRRNGYVGFSTNSEPSDVALLTCTYDTEGRPKGVPLTQADLSASVQNIRSLYGLVETDATVSVLPLDDVRFLLGVVLSSLAAGASVTLDPSYSLDTFWDDMLASGATWYAAMPSFHEILLDRHESKPEAQYPVLRFILNYGASLAPETLERLEAAFGAPVREDTAMTEILDRDGARVAPCIIVGTGPSGLAVAACLREQGVPSVVLERDDCIAPLWHKRCNYDGLRLHLPKKWFCELPGTPFPDDFSEYPTGRQYLNYVEDYAAKFEIRPEFNRTVLSAHYDETSGLWRVRVRATVTGAGEMEYICRWLVVATGEHAERIIPDIPGLTSFPGEVTHVGDYVSGETYRGRRVLVIGSGNSGKEVALDLYDHGARPAVVAWDAAHVLPRKVFGKPTLEVASMLFERWLPVRIADMVMAFIARTVLGDLAKLGLARIRAGHITVVPAVARFCGARAEFVDGRALDIDAVVLATGYRSNLPQAEWPRGDRDGYPATAFPGRWQGRCGLYALGFTPRGSGGTAMDAARIAEDIAGAWSWREGTEPAAASQSDRNGVHVLF